MRILLVHAGVRCLEMIGAALVSRRHELVLASDGSAVMSAMRDIFVMPVRRSHEQAKR